MNTLLQIVMIGLLIYIICGTKTDSDKTKNQMLSYKNILPEYLGRRCEITVKRPLVAIDIMMSVKGILTDADGEWVIVDTEHKKKRY